VTLAIALTPFLGGLTVQHQALLTRQLRLGRISSIRLGSALGSDLLGIGLAFIGAGYWALVIREVCRSLFVLLGIGLSCRWVPSWPARTEGMKQLYSMGGNLTAANMLGSLVSNFDKVVLGHFFGAVPTGFYRQAQYLVSAPTDQVVHPIFRVSEPGLSALQHEAVRYRNYYRKILLMISMLTMPLSVMVFVFAEQFTLILLGAKWLASAELIRILTAATFLTPSLWSSHQVLITLGRGRRYLWLKVVENLTVLTLVATGLIFGVKGVAAATPAAIVILMVPTLWYCFRDSPVTQRLFWACTAKPIISSLVMAAALLAVSTAFPVAHPFLAVLRGGLIGGFTYLVCFCLLPGGAAEIRRVTADIRDAFARRGARRSAGKSQEPAVGAA
jgi:PST family polysaccharide transporter